MDDDYDDYEYEGSSESNKKVLTNFFVKQRFKYRLCLQYTLFWIDGGANMFEGGEDCDFRRAIKVHFSELL